MPDRTILKLEIVEHDREYGPPQVEYVMTYADADLIAVYARLTALVASMHEWSPVMGGFVTRPKPDA